ncbi:MAG: hypothetical protein GWM92_21015 [Gemmatimonadetes bacterium]|nr:hypothetical protein [Gemmatimonadota bacterium]NIR81338.1 hypothetical protein [Gemmatimonadota bacterium]NIT90174.1 hypothetical protein [Gemmatimonadota bacterium]NIU34001.1 hypothetical protein [Gemmatimonadota bacterium]NIU38166.1 hypothetical protein [Gemmatimonadota bacterium]
MIGPAVPDVLVAGAGPAGSVTAMLLAREGWSVTLLERTRFPRPKACGECLNPGAVKLLAGLGLLERVRALDPAPIRGWRIEGPAGLPALGTFAPRVGLGLAVPRSRFDHALAAAAVVSGVVLEEGVRVEGAEPGGPGRLPTLAVRDRSGRTGKRRARVVVGADGLRSAVARAIGAHRRLPRLRKVSLTVRLRGTGPSRDRGRLALRDDRVLGLAPVHGHDPLWNATVVARTERFARAVARDARAFVTRSLEELGPEWREQPRITDGPWASGPFDWPTRSAVAAGILLVGDAAGYFDPLTGQGIYRALRSARLAARAVDRSLRNGEVSGKLHREYDRALSRAFGPGRRVQKIVEGVVANGCLRRAVLGRLARAPEAMDALIRVTGDAAPVRSLAGPGAWAPFLAPTLAAGARRSGARRGHERSRRREFGHDTSQVAGLAHDRRTHL